MSIVALQDVHVGFERRTVLEGVDWHIHRGEKVGLVGRNGSGKTTLFRLILGELAPTLGTVTRGRGLQIAYLPQEPRLDSAATLHAEVASTFDNLRRLEDRLAEVGSLIAEHHDDPEKSADLMEEYDELTRRLEAAGGYRYEVLVNEVLGGLGFSPADHELPVAALSGGQKCRAALARLLLQEADLLLLDEPTNHLDIEATAFLERFLAGYHGAAVIVSHDRYLLDRVVDRIADLEDGRVTVYPCAYSDYVESKRIRQTTAEREYQKQAEWIRHQREYAERVKADKSRSRQARGRLRFLDRMERDGRVLARRVHVHRRMALDFAPARRAGDMVLRCEGVRKAFGDVVLFDDFNLEIFRGEKFGIVGPNGVGKSTLLKMVMGRLEPDAGKVRLFENLDVGYYDQERAGLNLDDTVLDAIRPRRTAAEEQELRGFLGRFLFTGDDVFKRIGDLSGGEQSRVMLARLMWSRPQVLVLDEPTNHLDIPSKEALEEALIAYEGGVLIVSHDRYFLDRVVNRLLVLPERGRYEILTGNWSTWEEKLAAREAQQRAAEEQARRQARENRPGGRKPQAAAPGTRDDSPYARWSLEELEEAIIQREARLAETEERFADPEVCRDPEKARALHQLVRTLREELQALNAAWEARG